MLLFLEMVDVKTNDQDETQSDGGLGLDWSRFINGNRINRISDRERPQIDLPHYDHTYVLSVTS